MAYTVGEWVRYDDPSNMDFNQIRWRPLAGRGRMPRYAWVQIPDGMWSSNISCTKANGYPSGCGQRILPEGVQWIQIQFGWSYGERSKAVSNPGLPGGVGFSPRYHEAVPDVARQTGDPCAAQGSFRPASVFQFTHPAHAEVLNTAVNPRTGMAEKYWTLLAQGAMCAIPEVDVGAAAKIRTFYAIASDGTYTADAGWKARMGPSGPYFTKE